MEESSTSSRVTKRRRLSSSPLVAEVTTTVNDIPIEQWLIIADFLPKTSRLLLAIALTAPPKSFRERGWKGQPSVVGKAIISATTSDASFDSVLEEIYREARAEAVTEEKLPILKKVGGPEQQDELFRQGLSQQFEAYYGEDDWTILDFVDIPVLLASRLTDDDIGAILVCIDAKNNLERLKLTHCFNVVGHGLEPLRSSSVLEKLDLGLVREFIQPYWIESAPAYDEYAFHNTVKLSEEPVCDIIDSILRAEDNELIRLQYPYKWFGKKLFSDKDPVYGNQKPDPKIVPKYHNQIIRSERMKQLVEDHNAVANKYSCSLYFGFNGESAVCSYFQDEYVETDCGDVCLGCYDSDYVSCSHCDVVICRDCSDTIGCSECGIRYCALCCRDNGFKDEVRYCDDDECEAYCRDCRSSGCRDGSNDCTFCKGMVYDAVLSECNAKQSRIESNRDEMEKLRRVSESDVQTDNTEEKNTDPFITIRIFEDGKNNSTAHSVFKEDRTTKLGKVFNCYASSKGLDFCRLRFTLGGVLIHPDTTLESLGLSGCVDICCFRAIDIAVRNQFDDVTLFKLQSASTNISEVIRTYASMKGVDINRLRFRAKEGSLIHPNGFAHVKVMSIVQGLKYRPLLHCTVQGEFLRDKYEFSQITIRSRGINHLGYGRKPSPNTAINVWCSIADFLPKTSRALLAVALTAPSSSFRENGWSRKPNALSKAIIARTADGSFDTVMGELYEESLRLFHCKSSQLVVKKSLRGDTQEEKFCEGLSEQLEEYYDSQWEIMDFVDIPVSLASRLTDDDIGAILVCIGAKHKLKRLKLTHCTNVVGDGLEPLRSSTALEKLDLGLYRQFEQPLWHGGRYTFDHTKLSLKPICDLLDSILHLEGNSFTRLQYPCKPGWLARMPLFKVNKKCWEHEHKLCTTLWRLAYQHDAVINNYTSSFYFGFANGKEFCSSLVDVWKRDIIDACLHCLGTDYGYCLHCKRVHCKTCVDKDDRFECNVCRIGYCQQCKDDGFESPVSVCEADCEAYCGDCRLNICRNGSNNCKGCKGMAFDTLLEECHTKQAQINSQRDEITRLRRALWN